MVSLTTATDLGSKLWQKTLLVKLPNTLTKPSKHVLKFWLIDPGIVLKKLVVGTGGVKFNTLAPRKGRRVLRLKTTRTIMTSARSSVGVSFRIC
ncbi:hypothetical protein [Hymenobacter crusticola]|uniref:Gylcosyl hydrolase 115 C-terminal domain-containing protein n=1 Tax=Hymenobacter crusticola TaxID=1770526 RepID=A0A243WEW9_9BACT|nr:hypothetical protein BXP70_09765 [Hymenobacter crusticola]